eukprot:1153277-Pelagomonas_calceolata.AAC.1
MRTSRSSEGPGGRFSRSTAPKLAGSCEAVVTCGCGGGGGVGCCDGCSLPVVWPAEDEEGGGAVGHGDCLPLLVVASWVAWVLLGGLPELLVEEAGGLAWCLALPGG